MIKEKRNIKTQIWKKILCIGLVFAMLCGCFSVSAKAGEAGSVPEVITGTYHYRSEQSLALQNEDTFLFREDCFMRPSYLGCDHLLVLSAQTALSSTSRYDNDIENYQNDPSMCPENLLAMLRDMGFQNVETNAYYRLENLENSAAVAVGRRSLYSGGKNYTLLAVVPRSAGYKQEWAGNFTVGEGNVHKGFKAGRDEILRFIKQYIARYNIQGDLKVWISGQSRGAALGNLLGGFLAGGGMEYFGDSVRLTPEDIYCYGFAVPRAIKNGASKEEVLCVEGARGGEYASDTPGEAYIFKGSGTVNLHDPAYSCIRIYSAEYDFVAQLPPPDWGFENYGTVCSLDDNGNISAKEMLTELASCDEFIYQKFVNGGDFRSFEPVTLDIKNLSFKPTGESGKAAFKNCLYRMVSALSATVESNQEFAEGGTEEMFKALSGIFGMLETHGAEMGESVNSSAVQAAVLSYLAYATEKLRAEGRAENETEAVRLILAELFSYAGFDELKPTSTVDNLVTTAARLAADHKSSELVQDVLSKAEQMIPEEKRGLARSLLSLFYPFKKGESLLTIPMSELLYAAIYACAYGPLSGSAAASGLIRLSAKDCRKVVYTAAVTLVSDSVPGIKTLIGTDAKGNPDGSNRILNCVTGLLPELMKGPDGEAYATAAEAADVWIVETLNTFFAKCDETIVEKGLYTSDFLRDLKKHEENLKAHVSDFRILLANVLLWNWNKPFDISDHIEAVATVYKNVRCLPVAHFGEMYVAWTKAALKKGTFEKSSSSVTLNSKTAVYTGSTISVDEAQVQGSSGKVTYSYFSDPGCTKKVSAHKNSGTYYVKAAVAEDAHNKAAVSKPVKLTIKAKKISPSVTLSSKTYKYDGTVKKPTVTVKDGNKVLKEKTDYTVSYSEGRKNVGTYKVTVRLKGNYSGNKEVSFKITQAENGIKNITPASKTFKFSTLKNQPQNFQLKVTDKFGAKKTFALDNNTKAQVKKFISVSKTGKVTVKKGTPKGTYTVKIKVSLSGTKNYKAKTLTKIITITIK
ncbi:MAG: hypothetical protein IKF90_15430 [Parasporobacterium sp.]|nr:hypothetical protein [Parasporobacterium sp.]